MRRILIFSALTTLLLSPLVFASSGSDSSSTTIFNRWSVGVRLSSSGSNYSPDMTLRFALGQINSIETKVQIRGYYGSHKSTNWSLPDSPASIDDYTHHDFTWRIGAGWRHQIGTKGDFAHYCTIGVNTIEFYENESTDTRKYSTYSLTPEASFGIEWRPASQIAVFTELGAFLSYVNHVNKYYSKTSDGIRFLRSKSTQNSMSYGILSAFGFTFYL